MKIGIDCRMYGSKFTGIGIYVERLVDYLARNDSENEYVLFLSKSGMFDCAVDAPNFRKVEADVRHYSFGEQAKFPLLIAKEGLDLMHFTHFNAPIAYRGRTVVTIHDLTLTFYPGRKMTSSVHRLAYETTIRSVVKRAKKIFAVSAHTRKDLVEILDVPEDRIAVIHNGIDRERFEKEVPEDRIAQVKKKLGIDRKYFLYTGVFREHKNLVRLVEAFAPIALKYHDVDLVLAGKEDPEYKDVRDAIVRLGIGGRVRLPGFVEDEDIVPLYRGAEAYVFPSLYEGFGLPVIEAMAAWVPVLCSKGSSLTEVAGEGNVVFFNPLRVEMITEAMDRILTEPELRKELVAKGLVRAKEFSWEQVGKAVHEQYLALRPKEHDAVRTGVGATLSESPASLTKIPSAERNFVSKISHSLSDLRKRKKTPDSMVAELESERSDAMETPQPERRTNAEGKTGAAEREIEGTPDHATRIHERNDAKSSSGAEQGNASGTGSEKTPEAAVTDLSENLEIEQTEAPKKRKSRKPKAVATDTKQGEAGTNGVKSEPETAGADVAKPESGSTSEDVPKPESDTPDTESSRPDIGTGKIKVKVRSGHFESS